VKDQIGELKRGTEIVVCTPGRMIDILTLNSGRITNLKRVTYVVLDEADRMFDMGFEPQISKIVENIRKDRQTVMFSATFPRQVELLAKKILNNPLEITVGGRSVVCADVEQHVEVREDDTKFHRLLELLGEWNEKGSILVFVDRQETCDNLFRDLLKHGYAALSLHGGKDQADRDCTIADFKNRVSTVMVATSVAARGLDVKELILVVNYDVPNHHEDYVHRCGRTGRAGNKGFAYTFISPEEDKFAPDLVKALKESELPVPEELQKLADGFKAKVQSGQASQFKSSGFGGKGFKFDESEAEQKEQERKQQKLEYGVEVEEPEETNEETLEDEVAAITARATSAAGPPGMNALSMQSSLAEAVAKAQAQAAAVAAASAGGVMPTSTPTVAPSPILPMNPAAVALQQAAAAASAKIAASLAASSTTLTPLIPPIPTATGLLPLPSIVPLAPLAEAAGALPNISAAAAFAAQLNSSMAPPQAPGVGIGIKNPATPAMLQAARDAAAAITAKTVGSQPEEQHFMDEFEINDYPQQARWKVTHKDALSQITEWTGACITTKGVYCQPGKQPPTGERKLYLSIEGPTPNSIIYAKNEIKRIITEITSNMRPDQLAQAASSRYNVLGERS